MPNKKDHVDRILNSINKFHKNICVCKLLPLRFAITFFYLISFLIIILQVGLNEIKIGNWIN